MQAKDLLGYIEDLIKKADDPDNIEILINGGEVTKLEYRKEISSDALSEEFIDITS